MAARPRHASLAGALLLALTAAGCGPFALPDEARPDDRIPVQVENRNTYDATIYVYPNAQRVRLGQVRGLETRVLHSPATVTGQLRFEVRLLAVGAFDTHSVAVAPGDTVVITVPADLHRRR